jgi:hypothetical protein
MSRRATREVILVSGVHEKVLISISLLTVTQLMAEEYKKKDRGYKVQKDESQNIFKLELKIGRKKRKTIAPV